MFLAERGQVAEDAHEEPGVDELGEEGGILGEQDGTDVRRHRVVLGQRPGAHVDVVDEVLDREAYRHVVVVEDDDGVLTVGEKTVP